MRVLRMVFSPLALVVAVWPSGAAALEEPVYQGQPLRDWLDDLAFGRHTSAEQRQQSVEAIRALGMHTLPCLLERLQAKPPNTAHEDLLRAELGFDAPGPLASPAIGPLIEMLRPALDAA